MAYEIPGLPGVVQLEESDLTDEERALAAWAQGEINPNPDHPGTLTGAAAVAQSTTELAAAIGGEENLHRLLRGRPALDPTAKPGSHSPVRQVRLPEQMNAELSELAAAEGRRASEIIREALAAYLSTHRAS